jgi:hypothetical protein
MESVEQVPRAGNSPEDCLEIIKSNSDPKLRSDAAVHLLALIESGMEIDEARVKTLRSSEREMSVRTKLSRVLNKLFIRKLLDDDPTSYYDPKLSLEEELRLYEEIERLKGVYDKAKRKSGAFDERYLVFNVKIGSGGMARILRGIRRSDHMPVAIKYLMLEDLSRYASVNTLTALFRNEGRLLCEKLDHPNVIKGYEFGVAESNYFIVLEYIEGGSLYDMIRKGPVDLDTFSAVGLQMCDGLDYIHKENVIHRDINSKNILIARSHDEALRVKVIDFGLALDKRGGFKPPPGFRGYNLPYTSPQQQASFNNVDERDDVYSLGIVFYEMLGGRLDDRGILPEEVTMFPKNVNRGIGKCIERERDRRWKDVSELRKELFGVA